MRAKHTSNRVTFSKNHMFQNTVLHYFKILRYILHYRFQNTALLYFEIFYNSTIFHKYFPSND